MAEFRFQDLVINVSRNDDGVPVLNFACPNTNPQGCGGGTNQGGGCVGDTGCNGNTGCDGGTQPGCGGGTNPGPGCGGGTNPGCAGNTNPPGCDGNTNPPGCGGDSSPHGCGGGTNPLFGVRLDSNTNIQALRDRLREVIGHLDDLEQEQGGGK